MQSRANPFQQFMYKAPPTQRLNGAMLPEAVKAAKSSLLAGPSRRSTRGSAAAEEKATSTAHGHEGSMQESSEETSLKAPNAVKRKVLESGVVGGGQSDTGQTGSETKRARVVASVTGDSSSVGEVNLAPSASQSQPDVQARCKVLLEIATDLVEKLQPLKFKAPVTHVYNPLEYAMESFEKYVTNYGGRLGTVLMVGMNPGPWGMAQTGVPFGDCSMVKDFLKITAPVKQPPKVHPKRLVYGFSCPYKEVSGQRIWGWARDRFKDPEVFFDRFYVINYCPLAFMEGPNGKLRTPDKLPAAERDAVVRICDEALSKMIKTIEPKLVVGIGQFMAERVRKCAGNVRTGTVMHPSPANPATNAGWAGIAERQLLEMGVELAVESG